MDAGHDTGHTRLDTSDTTYEQSFEGIWTVPMMAPHQGTVALLVRKHLSDCASSADGRIQQAGKLQELQREVGSMVWALDQ
jgi:hypothetical protein